jgi:uncharacterized protein (TIGR00297 family)
LVALLVAALFNGAVLARWKSLARPDGSGAIGLAAYPLTLTVLVLLFREDFVPVQVAWIAMAVGDGLAPVLRARGPAWGWNERKSLLGSAAAFAVAGMAMLAVAPWPVALAAAIVACIAESLPLDLDDNVAVPLAAAAACSAVTAPESAAPWWPAVVVGCSLAAAAALTRSITAAGLVAGATTAAFVFQRGGLMVLAALAALFVLGTGVTRLRSAWSARASPAAHELRGAEHVLANAGAAVLFLMATPGMLGRCAALAALAGALADTVSSEIGMLAGRTPRLLLLGPRVLTGTNGGMSWPGTLAALLTAAGCGLAVAGIADSERAGWVVGAAAFVVMLVDSLLGASIERHLPPRAANHVVNFVSSGAGGALAIWMLNAA